jgi:hypothetical protein
MTQLTGTCDLAYAPAPKEVALAQDYLTTYGPERSAFVVRHGSCTASVRVMRRVFPGLVSALSISLSAGLELGYHRFPQRRIAVCRRNAPAKTRDH